MMKPCRIQAISLTLAGRLSLAARAKVIPGCILALLMVLTGLRLEAQPRDAELRFHVGNPGGGNLSLRSIGAAAHLGCACRDTRGVVNRPAIPEPGRQTLYNYLRTEAR